MTQSKEENGTNSDQSSNHLCEKYTLIITEKPSAAKRLAEALDTRGKPEMLREKGVPYFIAERNRKLVLVPALGHLYTIVHKRGKRNYYPVFNFKWMPRNLAERGAKDIRRWIEIISKLSHGADEFFSACDYDLEGSLIGYYILKFACDNKEHYAKRMKFSTLMKGELEQAYEEALPYLDFALIEAGRTRHEVDWLYGINLSRALTLAAHRWGGRYSTLSTGRVQGPTLLILTKREKAIRSFVPTSYWEIKSEVEISNSIYEAEYANKKIEKKAEADAIVRACAGETGEVNKVEVRTVRQKPPAPFDLGTLQREAYSFFRYTPRHTLGIAQRLYLDALISYPRTSSQKLPPIINYKKILNALKRKTAYANLASKLLDKKELKPREGTKEDPAHPAVYPTGNLPENPLGTPEKKVWDLVVRRFMAVFGEEALKESLKIRVKVNGHSFFLRGRRILKKGWMTFYKPYSRAEEVFLSSIKEGDNVKFRRVALEDKFTSPPPRYNPSSLLKKMETLGIGTKATRGEVIQTLFNRGYIRDERITVTDLGFDVIDILGRYAPKVISVKLTQELESKMEQIQSSREIRENVLEKVVEQLKPQLKQFKENEESIGKALSEAIKRARTQERVLGKCPGCGTGNLLIIYSRKTRKRFIGCTNYFKGLCKTSFPLPQRGKVKPAGRNCKSCGWPKVLVWTKGRKTWRLCFNPSCPLKKKRRRI
jgi:DNA topoisomerase-1